MADLLLTVLALIVFFLVTLLVWAVVVNLWLRVPYVPSPWPVVDAMVRLADMKPGETVYDLGAGDCRLPIAAKRACPRARAIGLECTPTVFLWGKLRTALSRTGAECRFRNAFRQDLSDADVIFTYLSPSVMREFLPKFQTELRPGTRIISHSFTLPEREPAQTVPVRIGKKEKLVRLYRW
jgi:cyclopropane fatty-acyl-phospholipid synthase-like methyltransferase